ncbi:hypothetical protein M407DRAFT_241563 [Tulasnella calospora MUT 4182]|uniref:Uncharacterized protein n=1 Tax=Tulasnella calospora MUT 4182 TaxID=1051891 RepID=A0A0C3LDX6_9AGAM|nr:hypothetical protein M407DRAFT_241563 [Tulasnella calospora MUT 4182]
MNSAQSSYWASKVSGGLSSDNRIALSRYRGSRNPGVPDRVSTLESRQTRSQKMEKSNMSH